MEYDIKKSETCDFIYATDESVVGINSLILPNDLNLRTKNKFDIDIELIIKCDQVTTKPTIFNVKWDGVWEDDKTEICNHVQITKKDAVK